MRTGRLRLVFVADKHSMELERIVEFLNVHMPLVEVLAVEVKQYVAAEQQVKTLVPRVIGKSAQTEAKKQAGNNTSRQWDEASFFTSIEQRSNASVAEVARKLYEWAIVENNMEPRWGEGLQDGSFTPWLSHNGGHTSCSSSILTVKSRSTLGS